MAKLTEEQISECCDILRKKGVHTEAMSWGTLTEIAEAMHEFLILKEALAKCG